jgi:hypothetical protein
VGIGSSLLIAVVSYELTEKRLLALKRFFEARPAAPPAVSPAPQNSAPQGSVTSS